MAFKDKPADKPVETSQVDEVPEIDEEVEPTPATLPEPAPVPVVNEEIATERTDASGRVLYPWETTP